MQVVYHLGAPCTDRELLIKSLLKNKTALSRNGVVVPFVERYRQIVREAARSLKGQPASEDLQEAILDAIVEEDEIGRLVLSDPRFICINRLVVQGAQIWPMIGVQATNLRAVFPKAHVEFFIGMRDPATLIPALFHGSRFTDFAEFTENMQPQALVWSEMLYRLRQALPDCPVTVWCNEDTPLLWGQIMREMADVPPDMPLKGTHDLLGTIMDKPGFKRMEGYLSDNPPSTEIQHRRLISAFLDRYALQDAIEEELDVPGWTEDLVARIGQTYDDDMAEVARIPGVTFLTP